MPLEEMFCDLYDKYGNDFNWYMIPFTQADGAFVACLLYTSDPPSDELIASVEEELGYKLPASYIWLMKQHNGGIPVNTCYPTETPTTCCLLYTSRCV